jgi:hypothetical protein
MKMKFISSIIGAIVGTIVLIYVIDVTQYFETLTPKLFVFGYLLLLNVIQLVLLIGLTVLLSIKSSKHILNWNIGNIILGFFFSSINIWLGFSLDFYVLNEKFFYFILLPVCIYMPLLLIMVAFEKFILSHKIK